MQLPLIAGKGASPEPSPRAGPAPACVADPLARCRAGAARAPGVLHPEARSPSPPPAALPRRRRPTEARTQVPGESGSRRASGGSAGAPAAPPANALRRAHQPSHHTRTAGLLPGPGCSAPPANPCPFRIMSPRQWRGTTGPQTPSGRRRPAPRTRRHTGLTRHGRPIESAAPPRGPAPPVSRGQWRARAAFDKPSPAPPLAANSVRRQNLATPLPSACSQWRTRAVPRPAPGGGRGAEPPQYPPPRPGAPRGPGSHSHRRAATQ